MVREPVRHVTGKDGIHHLTHQAQSIVQIATAATKANAAHVRAQAGNMA